MRRKRPLWNATDMYVVKLNVSVGYPCFCMIWDFLNYKIRGRFKTLGIRLSKNNAGLTRGYSLVCTIFGFSNYKEGVGVL